ncbi:uncharacterized protein YgbK (DUF1537 family) [Microbacterium foliorum]|uniref:four-carbon acid sugar kinase family protein n=1 Tax=Microbacterium foliorum TaxID=104336 RepID=UPI00209DE14A|nr:four-carbon acid sugar kinase family protein [Microbacterium foliorum]MCP1428205.1 uncharacterized protein YgbK (DUF1537 family) [Microbacterium foliorum]
MKTIILDDDPTGTQSAANALILLESNADALTTALRERDAVYVQTNSRALDEEAAVALVRRVRADAEEAAARLGDAARFVLRGDSTLRGHVFAETEVFLDDGAVMVFVPAFPAGGRTTVNGVHRVVVDGVDVPAHETEYAQDPVFPFSTAVLVDYVAEKSARTAVSVPLADVRANALPTALLDAAPGTVVLPDAVTDSDIRLIARAIDQAVASGVRLVVRSASPLAARLAGVESVGMLSRPLLEQPRPTLLVCGSHTHGATAQLAAVTEHWARPEVLHTAAALESPTTEGTRAAEAQSSFLDDTGLAFITTERTRSSDHGTLDHGERVMTALTTAVRALLPAVDVVVSKGGITSAEVASTGIGAMSAVVLGQILPGVSVWRMRAYDDRPILYVVVPGNVGGPETLTEVLDTLSVHRLTAKH